MSWQNEVFEDLDWFESVKEEDKIDKYEAKNYSKGCRICGSITGEHGFSFTTNKVK